MTLFDYYLQYMTEVFEGKRPAPAGMEVTATEETERMKELGEKLMDMGMENFVRACAAQDGTVLPEEVFAPREAAEIASEPPASADEPDPDAGKHPFEVFLDCIALDDGLVTYLIDVLKRRDDKEFFKLCQITTKMDLDPAEFLYWLSHRQDYGTEEEKVCAAVMDECLERLRREGRMDVAAALLSGDQKTFEVFRCEAPELVHLPEATFDWYAKNYLDRDYPIRMIMKWNGVAL